MVIQSAAPLPNDHSRANRGRIREQAERGRRKREEVDKTVPLLLPSSSAGGKYSHVPSKVITNLQVGLFKAGTGCIEDSTINLT